MESADYIFAIQDKDHNFWQVDKSGAVTKNANPYFLDYSPSGWDETSVSNVRNKKYWGIDRNVTIPLSYVKDGANIIKHIFYNLGSEESCFLSISTKKLSFSRTIFTRGNTTLVSGANIGTITGIPGETVTVRLAIAGAGFGDIATGNIGGTNVFVTPGSPIRVLTITIPDSGSVSFKITNLVNIGTVKFGFPSGSSVVPFVYGFWYKQIYRGEVDLSTFNHAGAKVTCSTLEDGLPKFLKANENTAYEFPFNVPEVVPVRLDGIRLHEIYTYQELTELEIKLTDYNVNSNQPTTFFTPTIHLTSEGDSTGVLFGSQTLEGTFGVPWADRLNSTNFILQNVGINPISVHIAGTLAFKCTDQQIAPFDIKFRFIKSTQQESDAGLYEIISEPIEIGRSYSEDYMFDIELAPDEKLFLEGGFFIQDPGLPNPNPFIREIVIEFTEASKSSMSFETRNQSSIIKAFRMQYLFEQLVSKMTDGSYTAGLCSFFTRHADKLLTSGNAIRGLEDATIKISFSDLFQWCDCLCSVGIIEKNGVIILEEKQDLIDYSYVIDLSAPAGASMKVSLATEYLFNELEIGYPEIKNDVGVLNGNEEFNTKFLFSLGTTKKPAKLDKVSKIKTSCYEIEKIRVTTLDKATTDYKADNDVFALHIEDTQPVIFSSTEAFSSADYTLTVSNGFASTLTAGYKIKITGSSVDGVYTIESISGNNINLVEPIGTASLTADLSVLGAYNLDRSLNAAAAGLIEPDTVFNLEFSPKRNFLRNGRFINSSLYKMDTRVFKFINADKNNKLEAGGVIEKADVTVGTLGDKFFVPVHFDFEVEAPDNLLELLDRNPLAIFKFPFEGAYYKGILVKVSLAPSSRKAQQYTLLSTADNNLSSLIDYYG